MKPSFAFEIGMKVTYQGFDKNEKGIIKSFNDRDNIAFVVYHCNNEWDNYKNYTGASTNIEDLVIGWDND